jgi:glucosamine 6-phosphate synthetase-like amidotransferase/phosphosugar isomerase protein
MASAMNAQAKETMTMFDGIVDRILEAVEKIMKRSELTSRIQARYQATAAIFASSESQDYVSALEHAKNIEAVIYKDAESELAELSDPEHQP